MPVRLKLGRREFRSSWFMTALTALACVLFVNLGQWQWHRGNLREAQWAGFEQGAGQVLAIGSRKLADIPRFQQVSASGRFDTERQFLLDNRTHEGRAGYEVLTPLQLLDGRLVLVDRGWVPFSGFRDRLPDISFEAAPEVTITGRVDELPPPGLARGRTVPLTDAPWPKVTSFPRLDDLSAALGLPLEPHIVLLDPKAPNGFIRDWKPPGLEPGRHWSYAIQWWSFAGLAIILWLIMGSRGTKKEA